MLAADAPNIDITAIPASYLHLYIVGQFRSTAAATGDFLLLKMNGDGGANYYNQALDGNGAVASAGQDVAQTRGLTTLLSGDTAPASSFLSYFASIPMYAGANTKTLTWQAGQLQNVGSNFHVVAAMGMWNNAAAITRLTFSALTGPNLKAGSRVTVYGLAST